MSETSGEKFRREMYWNYVALEHAWGRFPLTYEEWCKNDQERS